MVRNRDPPIAYLDVYIVITVFYFILLGSQKIENENDFLKYK
jgi:hypothetical protein